MHEFKLRMCALKKNFIKLFLENYINWAGQTCEERLFQVYVVCSV